MKLDIIAAMYPEIMIGSFGLSTHLLLNLLAAVVFGVGVSIRSRHKYPHPPFHEIIDLTFHLFCGILAGALVGATLPYLVMSLFGHPLPPYWWMGWQNWFGAVAGGSLAGLLYCRRNQRQPAWSFDMVAPLLPVALALVRTGCLLAGDSQGKLTTQWPAMVLPDPNGVWASRYPTQPVDILINLLIAIVLFAFERWVAAHRAPGWPFSGFLFWLYVILFCGQRIFFEFWRADTLILIAPFTWNHLYCIIGLLLAGVGIWRGLHRRQPVRPVLVG